MEAQFEIAGGASLASLGLDGQAAVGPPRGHAVQARVVVRGTGAINAYKEPAGPGVRVDACGYLGYAPPPQFDPLLAKVIGAAGRRSPGGDQAASFQSAIDRTRRALDEFHVSGVATNLAQLQAILAHPAVRTGDARTTLLEETPALLVPTSAANGGLLDLLRQQATLAGLSMADGRASVPGPIPASPLAIEPGQQAVMCSMAGSVTELRAQEGARVAAGEALLIVSAMKMESQVSAPCAGIVVAVQPLQPGDSVDSGEVVAVIRPSGEIVPAPSGGGRCRYVGAAAARGGCHAEPGAAPGWPRDRTIRGSCGKRARGKLTCRERIDLLLDDGSFREIGSVAGFASYDDDGAVAAFTPASHVGGWGRIEGRPAVVCADDFTSRGGHADGAIAAKSHHLDKLALEMRVPSIRLLDGSSGGGSVAAMVPAQQRDGERSAKESSGAIQAGQPRVAGEGGSYLPAHLGSSLYTEQLATVPVVNMLLGSVVGIGAAKAVLGHFSVMARDTAQLFVAGPPVVRHAMGYDISKEDLGGWHIHCRNGSVDNLAETEEEAAALARRFLSYLPPSVYEAPPVQPSDPGDPPDRREEELFTIVPRKRTATFDLRHAIGLLADRDSFFEIGSLWGTDQVTGFVRFNGYPMGVIGSDSPARQRRGAHGRRVQQAEAPSGPL